MRVSQLQPNWLLHAAAVLTCSCAASPRLCDAKQSRSKLAGALTGELFGIGEGRAPAPHWPRPGAACGSQPTCH